MDGLKILVPESRELDLFAAMLEGDGAAVLRCPLVTILDLEDTAEARAWMERLISRDFDDVIWLTGEGLRRLLTVSDQIERRQAFVEALGRIRSITRGPKPARALRELGLTPDLAAATPTSQGVLDALAGEDVSGRHMGVQLYPGDGGVPLVDALRARGAVVSPVTPYRYASQTDAAQVLECIRLLAGGQIGMIAFTSSPQIDRLFNVAREAAMEDALRRGLAQTLIASIGPVMDETLHRYGLAPAIRPEKSFHLKPLVRAIAAAWRQRTGSRAS